MGGVVRQVEKTVKKIIEDPLPIIEAAILTVVLGPEAGLAVFETQAASAAAANAIVTVANGGDIKDAAKAGVISYGGSLAAGELAQPISNATGIPVDVTAGAVKGAVGAAATGQDPVTGAIVGGATPVVTDVAKDIVSGTPETPTGTTDYSLLPQGATVPGQGFKAEGSEGFKVGQTTDYGAPLDTTLPRMGGGTGLTATTPEGQTISQPVPTFGSELAKEAERRGTQELTGAVSRGVAETLSPTKSTTADTTALTSTGLFSPTSIVPTALTGIAPVGRGKPILGGEDEEATGTWGAKTLRG